MFESRLDMKETAMDLQSQIQAIIERAAQEIADLVAQQAVDAVTVRLSGRSGGAATSPKRTAKSSDGAAAKGGRAKGEKRSQESIAKLTEDLRAFVAKNPGLRIEEINKQMGTSTKDLALPIRRLVAEKSIATKGEKRATKYFPKAKK